jgi:ABC-type polysaccharide/polyol phosphate transport system ATPase subunit
MALDIAANGQHVPAAVPLVLARNVSLHIKTVRKSAGGLALSPLRIVMQSMRQSARIHNREILSGLDFTIEPGDRVGLIGANGAGKSTLLTLLNGALRPSSGVLEINATAHALMNVRLGVRPRATGIENILLSGYRLGLRTDEIRTFVGEIQEFAELGDQIYDPISTYSAGMQLRLAFAIATAIVPDLLLMDEWIGAGDLAFRKKAGERLLSVVRQSRGLVIASHNEPLLREVCDRVILLKKGRIDFIGSIDEGFRLYNKS